MIKWLYFCLTPLALFANVHYAKIEPYEHTILKSAVSGEVLDVALADEGRVVENKRVIHIDDRLDKKNLASSKESLTLLDEMIALNEKMLKTLKGTLERQKHYYEKMRHLQTTSKRQKDTAYTLYSSANVQYLTTQEKVIGLKQQRLEMRYKIESLQRSIAQKSLVIQQKFLSKLLVHKGEYVMPATPLAVVDDLHQAKLVLFLTSEELENIEQKSLYLNGKKSHYTIHKIWKVTDEKFISTYRAEVFIDAPKNYFSQLVKVEIKE